MSPLRKTRAGWATLTPSERSASWVIRHRVTRAVVCETFSLRLVSRLNLQTYEAVPIGEYLGGLNRALKNLTVAQPENLMSA